MIQIVMCYLSYGHGGGGGGDDDGGAGRAKGTGPLGVHADLGSVCTHGGE